MAPLKLPFNKKWLYVGGGGFLLFLMLILSLSPSTAPQSGEVLLTALPQTPEPDADSPADTIKTLTATVSSLINDVAMLNQANQELSAHNDELIAKTNLIEHRVAQKLQGELENHRTNQEQLGHDVKQLTIQMHSLQQSIESGGGRSVRGAPHASQKFNASNSLQWVRPLETQTGAGLTSSTEKAPQPYFTIPQNATLVNSTTMTALIGRVPVENRVVDPMPFKVVNGADNLAANGLVVEGLEGAIWSGYTVGDWALSCVSGSVTSVTFVFEDGRIRTIGENHSSQDRLGWISDTNGVPCIKGERKTNVRNWLLAQLGVGATSAAADAIANANTMVEQSPSGFREAFIDGDIRDFVLGKSVAGSARTLADWLTERAAQEFDAIFVMTGQSVAIHVDRSIQIDYEPEGRKLNYENNYVDRRDLWDPIGFVND